MRYAALERGDRNVGRGRLRQSCAREDEHIPPPECRSGPWVGHSLMCVVHTLVRGDGCETQTDASWTHSDGCWALDRGRLRRSCAREDEHILAPECAGFKVQGPV